MWAHVTCLGPTLCGGEGVHLLPISGDCPRCGQLLLWGKMVRQLKSRLASKSTEPTHKKVTIGYQQQFLAGVLVPTVAFVFALGVLLLFVWRYYKKPRDDYNVSIIVVILPLLLLQAQPSQPPPSKKRRMKHPPLQGEGSREHWTHLLHV